MPEGEVEVGKGEVDIEAWIEGGGLNFDLAERLETLISIIHRTHSHHVGPSGIEDIRRDLVLDSLAPLALGLDLLHPVVDLGSGIGLPGIPLGLAGYGPIYLVEKRLSRHLASMEIVRALDLSGKVISLKGSFHDLAHSIEPPPETVVAKAFGPADRVLIEAGRLETVRTVMVYAGRGGSLEVRGGWTARVLPYSIGHKKRSLRIFER